MLDRPGVDGAILLTDRDELLLTAHDRCGGWHEVPGSRSADPARPLGPVRRRRRHRHRSDRPERGPVAGDAPGRRTAPAFPGSSSDSPGSSPTSRWPARSIYGLLLSTKILDAIAHRPITFNLHQDLASIGLGLAGVHGVLLALDKTVPFSLPQIAVPGLSPHSPVAVAAGQVAFYLMAIVIASFYVRRTIGQRAWRLLHYLTFLAFVGATAHGLGAGTDSGTAWAWWIYVLATIAVVFLFGYRIVMSVSARRGRRSVESPGPAPAPRPVRASTT